jgi:hypothetical protein
LAIPAYYFGTYWLNNPDVIQQDGSANLYCWAPNKPLAEGLQNYAIFAEGVNGAAGWVNVTQGFLIWFEWGFLFFVIQAAAMLMVIVALVFAPLAMGSGITCCCVGCGQLVWLIVGMVLRWRAAGVICSGGNQMVNTDAKYDIQQPMVNFAPGVLRQSGQFLKVWLILNLCCIGCSCLSSICAWVLALVK